MEFLESLRSHFRVGKIEKDNLPFLVTSRPRDAGREKLALVLNDMGARKGVEVGVRQGFSSVVWLDANPEMHLTCIDPWLGRQEKFYVEALRRLASRNVSIHRAKSMEMLEKFPDGSLDFVHIDGDHEFDGVAPDIIFWSKKLKPGGVMAVHDYIEFYRGGVISAVLAYTRSHRIDPWFVTRDRLPTAFWQRP